MTIQLSHALVVLLAHFIGDFIAQSSWMATNKSSSNKALLAHVVVYTLFLVLIKTNKSGYRGISWSTRDKVWRATIGVDNKSIGLGQHDNKLDAAKAYDTYVILNNLEHTINGVLHEPIRLHVETFNSGS